MTNATLATAGALLVGSLVLTAPAFADGKKDCTVEPQAKWKKAADAEAMAKQAGYEVRRSKIEGTCYEVYGVKDGQLYELFYDPVELKLLLTVRK